MPDDYQWPKYEIFFEILKHSSLEDKPSICVSTPMNYISFDQIEISYKDLIIIIKYNIHRKITQLIKFIKKLIFNNKLHG